MGWTAGITGVILAMELLSGLGRGFMYVCMERARA